MLKKLTVLLFSFIMVAQTLLMPLVVDATALVIPTEEFAGMWQNVGNAPIASTFVRQSVNAGVCPVIAEGRFANQSVAQGGLVGSVWRLCKDGILEIDGGFINWTIYNGPWQEYRDEITGVIITGPIIAGSSLRSLFRDLTHVTEIEGLHYFDTSRTMSMENMFRTSTGIIRLDLGSFDTSNVTNMTRMFTNMHALREVTLGSQFSFITDVNANVGIPSINQTEMYTGMWQNVGSGTVADPTGEFVFTSAQLISQFDVTMNTFVWQPVPRATGRVVVEGGVIINSEIEDDRVDVGTIVEINANIPAGYQFVQWESTPVVAFEDATSPTTTFVMPYEDIVMISAIFEAIPLNSGWVQVENYRFFYQEGVRRTGWFWYGEDWYFLNPANGASGHTSALPHGAMRTGLIQVNDEWYFLYANGQMARGWSRAGTTDQWYFFNPAPGGAGRDRNRLTGARLAGWVRVENDWFFMNSNGRMQTGWVRVENDWFFMNSSGRMQTGWVRVENDWFFMNSSGRMQTGWVRVENDWFFMNSSGRMQTGWREVPINNASNTLGWFYFRSNGRWDRDVIRGALTHPMPGARVSANGEFGWRNGSWHAGIDLAHSNNASVLAASSGIVTLAGWDNFNSPSQMGWWVIISHNINGQRVDTVYAHLRDRPLVSVGQTVRRGQQIGIQGNTGHSFGDHLHFEVHPGGWHPNNGWPSQRGVNPRNWINF